MSKSIVFFLALVAAIAGCATGAGYQPQVLVVDGDKSHLLRVVQDTVVTQGWQIVAADRTAGMIEALGPVDDAIGIPTRERWRFLVWDNAIAIERWFEVRFDDHSPWENAGTQICATYEYAREHQQLAVLYEKVSGDQLAKSHSGSLAAMP